MQSVASILGLWEIPFRSRPCTPNYLKIENKDAFLPPRSRRKWSSPHPWAVPALTPRDPAHLANSEAWGQEETASSVPGTFLPVFLQRGG